MLRPDGLTGQARRLLMVLRERGDWMTLKELAEVMNYAQPVSYHATLLRNMAEQGLIEMRQCRSGKQGPDYYEYKAKPQ